MDPETIAHTLVPAHTARVRELADLLAGLERAASADGVDSAAARDAHQRLIDRIIDWEMANREAERADVVTLSAAEREGLRQDVARALPYAESDAEATAATSQEQAVVQALRRMHAAFPTTVTRAALVRFRRSAARLTRFEQLNGPVFTLAAEAALLSRTLTDPSLERPRVELDAVDGFHSTLALGLRICASHTPGAVGAAGLGLGTSPALPLLLGVSGQNVEVLHERWDRLSEPSNPFARYPYVPRARFCALGVVRCDLESTGPIGWAAGEDVTTLAADLRAGTREHPELTAPLEAVAMRVEQVARRGEAVVGFIEYMPPEAEGQRRWLIDPEAEQA